MDAVLPVESSGQNDLPLGGDNSEHRVKGDLPPAMSTVPTEKSRGGAAAGGVAHREWFCLSPSAPPSLHANKTRKTRRGFQKPTTLEQQELCPYSRVLNCALHLHQALGPGLLESVYEVTLARKLRQQGLRVERQMPMPIEYEGGAL